VTGTVQSSDADGAVLQVLVDEVTPVDGFPNLATDTVGQTVVVNVPLDDARDTLPGTRVRCRVRKTGVDRFAALPGEVELDV
jgi:hypothetical protein